MSLSSEADIIDLLAGQALPCLWLVKFLAICNSRSARLTTQESVKLLEQAMSKGMEQPVSSTDMAEGSDQPRVVRMYYMILLLKLAALLTSVTCHPEAMQPAFLTIWHMIDRLVEEGKENLLVSTAQTAAALKFELQNSVLVAELAVPLLRQSVTSRTPLGFLVSSVSLQLLRNLLDCSPSEAWPGIAAGMVKLGKPAETAMPLSQAVEVCVEKRLSTLSFAFTTNHVFVRVIQECY